MNNDIQLHILWKRQVTIEDNHVIIYLALFAMTLAGPYNEGRTNIFGRTLIYIMLLGFTYLRSVLYCVLEALDY